MTNETSYQTMCPSQVSFAKQAETMDFWNEGFERTNQGEVNMSEDQLTYNEILDSYLPHEEPSGGPNGSYVTFSEV